MYSTKYKVHRKADLGEISIHTGGEKGKGDPYIKPPSKNPADDRFKGKQFELNKVSKPFGTFPFSLNGKVDPYTERVRYGGVKRQNGFGSGCPPNRDEYSNVIAIAQYREAIKSELAAAKRAAILQLKNNPKPTEDLSKVSAAKEERFEYDQVYNVVHDDGIGKCKVGKKLNLGVYRTTTVSYGRNCEKPSSNSANSRGRATDAFFNSGHLQVGEDF